MASHELYERETTAPTRFLQQKKQPKAFSLVIGKMMQIAYL
jgi:hypothetical protein